MIILTANLPNKHGPGPRRDAEPAPVRRVLIVCATRVEFERHRVRAGLTREEAVAVCDPADAQRAGRLYARFARRELVLLSMPAQGRAVMATLRAAGIVPARGQHFADTAASS